MTGMAKMAAEVDQKRMSEWEFRLRWKMSKRDLTELLAVEAIENMNFSLGSDLMQRARTRGW